MTTEKIVEIIRAREHGYFLELMRTEDAYGIFSTPSSTCRAKWAAINSLCRELGIEEI